VDVGFIARGIYNCAPIFLRMADRAGSSGAYGGRDGYAADGRALELSDCEAGGEMAGCAAGRMGGGGGLRVRRWWRWRGERRLLAPHGPGQLCTSWAWVQLRRRLPCLVWLPRYSRALFFIDASTGITVGVVLIPQVRQGLAPGHGAGRAYSLPERCAINESC
jgi:hypothetical protein